MAYVTVRELLDELKSVPLDTIVEMSCSLDVTTNLGKHSCKNQVFLKGNVCGVNIITGGRNKVIMSGIIK